MARNANESDLRSSKMAINAIKNYFWSSKMATGGHFVKKISHKLKVDLKWREMLSKVIFVHPKWPPAAICKENNKIKVAH